MTQGLRKFGLTLHVVSSVGWIGAVVAFLALAIAGIQSTDEMVIAGIYRAMALITWAAILPAAVVATVTGVVQSIGTPWGLLRYYWIAVKLVVTLLGLALLVVHLAPIDRLGAPDAVFADLHSVQVQMVIASALAVGVLLFATVLSIYKPKGQTGLLS